MELEGSVSTLYKPAIGPYLQQEPYNLQEHNSPPLNPFLYCPPNYVSASLNDSFLQGFTKRCDHIYNIFGI